MVFIDAPGTGYSRPLGDAKGSDFYGVDQDADAFSRAIIRYVTKFDRWDSPKFLFGESYGTTRSGALAYQLQERGVALNGVVLLSSIMNYGRRQPGLDRDYINYIPSYATTAWYHHKMANPPATVDQAAAEARAFAEGPYAAALEKGQTISPRGARFGRAADERSDRPLARVHRARQPARRPVRVSARSCCAMSARPSAAMIRATRASIPTRPAKARTTTRPTRQSAAPSSALSTPISRATSTTRPTWPIAPARARKMASSGTGTTRLPASASPLQCTQHRARSRRRDAQQPLSQGAFAERLVRHGDAVLRHRIRPQSHDAGAGAAAKPRVPLLSVRTHGLSEPRRAPPDAARRRAVHRRRGRRDPDCAAAAPLRAAAASYPQQNVALPSQGHN